MQVGTERRAGVPDLGQRRADLHGVANLHPQTSRLQVPVDRVDLGGDLQHDLVAAEVRQRFRGYHLVRGRVRLAVLDRDDGPIGDREHICSIDVVLLVRGAVPLIDPVALEEGPVDSERLGGLDAATVDDDSKIPMEVGCAARGGGEPTIPLEGRLDHGGGAAVDRDLGTFDHGGIDKDRSRRARRHAILDPVRHPFRRSAGRHDQIDVDRDRRRRGDLCHRLLVQEGLGRGDEHRPVDPRELLRSGIEDRQARQRDRLLDRVDDEQLVLDMVLAVVAADNLGVVNRTDQDRSRPATLLLGWPSARSEREGQDSGQKDKDAHLAISQTAGWEPADPVFWLVDQYHILNATSSVLWTSPWRIRSNETKLNHHRRERAFLEILVL